MADRLNLQPDWTPGYTEGTLGVLVAKLQLGNRMPGRSQAGAWDREARGYSANFQLRALESDPDARKRHYDQWRFVRPVHPLDRADFGSFSRFLGGGGLCRMVRL